MTSSPFICTTDDYQPSVLKNLTGENANGRPVTYQMTTQGGVQVCPDAGCQVGTGTGAVLHKTRRVVRLNMLPSPNDNVPSSLDVLTTLGMTWQEFIAISNFDWRCSTFINARFGNTTISTAISSICPIVNQAQCGNCYACSSTSSILDNYAIANGIQHLAYSDPIGVMQFIAAFTKVGGGCAGGDPSDCVAFVNSDKSGVLTKFFPKGVPSNVQYVVVDPQSTSIVNQKRIALPSSKGIIDCVTICLLCIYANGPITITMDATSLQTYKGGIVTGSIPHAQANHAIVCVGWGTYNNSDNVPAIYFVVRNSWGDSWGENGYFRIDALDFFNGYDGSAYIWFLPNSPVPSLGPALIRNSEIIERGVSSLNREYFSFLKDSNCNCNISKIVWLVIFMLLLCYYMYMFWMEGSLSLDCYVVLAVMAMIILCVIFINKS